MLMTAPSDLHKTVRQSRAYFYTNEMRRNWKRVKIQAGEELLEADDDFILLGKGEKSFLAF